MANVTGGVVQQFRVPDPRSMDALASSLERSPELFPHAYDPRTDALTLIRLSEADYARASFLDERAVGPHTLARTMPWGQVAAAVAATHLSERCQWIFHIGHVGSTLLSRLLGAADGIFALREPALLRLLAQMRIEPGQQPQHWSDAEFEDRLSLLLRLWSRSFRPQQTPVIKATSYVSELAGALLTRPAEPKAILLFVDPESYMATILGGANARQEALRLTAARLDRLHKRLGQDVWRLAAFSEGEGLALAWAVEMCALADAASAAGARALPLDFDRFLEGPHATLAAAFRHFDCDVADDAIAKLLAGPLMRTYSKAPEHAYSPALRRDILGSARRTHADEIAKGLAWLDRAAAGFPAVAGAMALAHAALP